MHAKQFPSGPEETNMALMQRFGVLSEERRVDNTIIEEDLI